MPTIDPANSFVIQVQQVAKHLQELLKLNANLDTIEKINGLVALSELPDLSLLIDDLNKSSVRQIAIDVVENIRQVDGLTLQETYETVKATYKQAIFRFTDRANYIHTFTTPVWTNEAVANELLKVLTGALKTTAGLAGRYEIDRFIGSAYTTASDKAIRVIDIANDMNLLSISLIAEDEENTHLWSTPEWINSYSAASSNIKTVVDYLNALTPIAENIGMYKSLFEELRHIKSVSDVLDQLVHEEQSIYKSLDALVGNDSIYVNLDALLVLYNSREALLTVEKYIAELVTNPDSIYKSMTALAGENGIYANMDALLTIYPNLNILLLLAQNIAALQNIDQNMNALKNVDQNISVLQSINEDKTKLLTIYQNLSALNAVHQSLDAIHTIDENIDIVQVLHTHKDALLSLYANKDALLALYQSREALTSLYTNREALLAIEANLEALSTGADSIHTNMAKLMLIVDKMTLLETVAVDIAHAEQLLTQAASLEQTMLTTAAQTEASRQAAEQAATLAVDTIAVLTAASTTRLGLTQYATDAEIAAGVPNKVINAKQHKDLQDSVNQILTEGSPDATEVLKGISRRATAHEVQLGNVADATVSPVTLKTLLNLYGLFGNSRIINSTVFADVDQCTMAGFYVAHGNHGMLNAPFGDNTSFHMIVGNDGYGASNQAYQIALLRDGFGIKYRWMTGKTFDTWRDLTHIDADKIISGVLDVDRLPLVSTSTAGAMSAADKTKLDTATTSAIANTLVLRNHNADIWASRFIGGLTGTADLAVKLAYPRTINVNLASGTAASFDGTANILPGVTGILGIANGGTGGTTVSSAISKLFPNPQNTAPDHVMTCMSGWNSPSTTTMPNLRNALGLGNTTGALSIVNGGTGAVTAAQALANLRGLSLDGGTMNSSGIINTQVSAPHHEIANGTKCLINLTSMATGNARPLARAVSTNGGAFVNMFFGDTWQVVHYDKIMVEGSTSGSSRVLKFNEEGQLSAPSFKGNGSELTQLNASNISSGALDASRLSGTIHTDRLPTVPISKGGTGAITSSAALINLFSAGAVITAPSFFLGHKGGGFSSPGSISSQEARKTMGLGDTLGAVPVANGGTGGTTASQALTNLGALPLAGGAMTGFITTSANGSHDQIATGVRAFINLTASAGAAKPVIRGVSSNGGAFVNMFYSNAWRVLHYDKTLVEGGTGGYKEFGFNEDGLVYAPAFRGEGTDLTKLNASNITIGTIHVDRVPTAKAVASQNTSGNWNNFASTVAFYIGSTLYRFQNAYSTCTSYCGSHCSCDQDCNSQCDYSDHNMQCC